MKKEKLSEYLAQHPDIEKQFSSNNDENILNLTVGSNKKIWWICPEGHEYQQSIHSKIHNNARCSVCYGSKVYPGVNDLETVHPELSKEWSPANKKKPSEVKHSSSYKAEWICSVDPSHVFTVAVSDRTRTDKQKRECPYCVKARRKQKALDNRKRRKDTIANGCAPDTMVKHFVRSLDDKDPNPTKTSRTQCEWLCDKGHTWTVSPRNYTGCPVCSAEAKSIFATHPSVVDIWDDERSPSEVSQGSAYVAHYACHKGHKWKAPVYSVTRSHDNGRSGCPSCSGSRMQEELEEFVCAILGDETLVVRNTRSVISPYELDIYIPHKNIAIEFNGLYWHSERQGKDENYHFSKWEACWKRGIQLLTVWEDEWRDKRLVIQSMIRHKLDISKQNKIYARKTLIQEITYSEARSFLDEYHVQGSVQATVYYGLFDKENNLCAVSSWQKNNNTLYLTRYATSSIVVGGMGKMLSKGKEFAEKNSCTKIVTFADKQVSDGDLYEKLGFIRDKDIPPDYKYIVDSKTVHKFNYRISRFKKDSDLMYKDGLSESQLAQLNGLDKVWDCGKIRYTLSII